MIIFIKLIDNSKYELNIDEKISIFKLKNIIYEKLKINILQMRLLYNGVPLVDNYTLSDYNIKNNSIIYLLYQLY